MSEPKLIARFMLGPISVPVFECYEPIAEDDPDGECDWNPHYIKVAARVQGAARWAVIIHELVHLALREYGLAICAQEGGLLQRLAEALRGDIDSNEREELLCNIVGLALADTLGGLLGDPPSSEGFWARGQGG